MKRLLYILFFACSLIVGCTDEINIPNDYGEDCIVLNIYNTTMTKAIDVKGAEYERKLNRLDCFFYKEGETNGNCVYYQKVDNINKIGQVEVPFYVDESLITKLFGNNSTCDVFVIANLSEEIIGDLTFTQNQEGIYEDTDLETLGQILLESNNNYDAIDKPFVMAAHAKCKKDSRNNAAATVSLVRAAAKVTFSVIIPQKIRVMVSTMENGVLIEEEERDMYPEGEEFMIASFYNGASKGCIYDEYPLAATDLFNMTDIRFTKVETIPEVPVSDSNPVAIPAKDVYTCEIPLYTYARTWTKGSPDAAYWTFKMNWGYDSTGDNRPNKFQTYYYQILINGGYRAFEPNHWYDMSVNVGVLGSTIEAKPTVLEELSYYVLNWTTETANGVNGSGDRLEQVEIQKYNFLEVPKKLIEMNNEESVDIRYNASHKIGVMWDRKGEKQVFGIEGEIDYPAFYISNTTGKPDAVSMVNDITLKSETKPDAEETAVNSNIIDNNNGVLTFTHTLNGNIYSPAYIFLTIWLDVNGDGVHDTEEEVLTEDITIVMYPPIYLIGERSAHFSVFVNGEYNKDRDETNLGNNNTLPYLYINDKQVGKAAGWDEKESEQYMHVITVSAFNDDNNEFTLRNNESYPYIIGDPRSKDSYKLGVPDGGKGWVQAKDVDKNERYLQYYYPTSTETGAFRIISPKFRISSKLAGYSHCDVEGAAYRCASYQESGYPAGRWRLPTTAEVLFVINRQKDGVIQELFVGTSNYCSATHTINNNNNTITIWDEIVLANNKNTVSVRCVYDEWYWGSEKEAVENANFEEYGGYEFTWGDEQIW